MEGTKGVAREKTLLVGLDAACWSYIEPLRRGGRLPVLDKLVQSGTRGILKSTMPACTPVAWASLVTGKSPGKHGIFDMIWRRPESYEFIPTSSRLWSGTPFWDYLNERGIRTGLVNVPFLQPPDSLAGFMLAGFGTPSSASEKTYPPGLIELIEQRYGSYEPWLRFRELEGATAEEKIAADRRHQARQVEIASELSDQFQVDVLVINLMLLDHANHLLSDMSKVNEAICQTDSDLGKLIQSFQPDNVMLISDHGARRVKGDFLLHLWLRDRDYCVQAPRDRSDRPSALNWILFRWLHGRWSMPGLLERLLRRLLVSLVPILPQAGAESFWRAAERDIPFARDHYLLDGELDYEQSRIFVGSSRSGILYFNLVGREPTGILSTEDAAGLSAGIAEEISRIEDPETGKPLFSAVYNSAEIYPNGTSTNAPDLVLDFYDGEWNIAAAFRRGADLTTIQNRYFAESRDEFGDHGREGIFILAGKSFTGRAANHTGELVDIPATLLHLYDVPIPDDYDGRVLTQAISYDHMAAHPIRSQRGDAPAAKAGVTGYTSNQEEEVARHLRALGYLE